MWQSHPDTTVILSPLQLLGNITLWRDTLSTESLKQLTVDGLLNRHLLLSLKNSPADISLVDKAKKVNEFSSSTHQEWIEIIHSNTHLHSKHPLVVLGILYTVTIMGILNSS